MFSSAWPGSACRGILRSWVIAAGLLIPGAMSQAAILNTELVINGNAETGNTTGWVSTGISAVVPDSFASGFGNYSFTGGTGPASGQTLKQVIDVSDCSDLIDSGKIISSFTIYLQTRAIPGTVDKAEATLSFLDGTGAILASRFFYDDINPFAYDWNLFTDARIVPTGTRSLQVLLNATRSGFSSSDGFFDEVSLELSLVPEPTTALIFAGAGLFGLLANRRRI